MNTKSLLKLIAVVFIALGTQNLFAGQKYWVRGSGTWDNSDTTHWASFDNGNDSVSVPNLNDTVYFTKYSFVGTSNFVYLMGSLQCYAIDLSQMADTTYFNVNGSPQINVSGWLYLTDYYGYSPFTNFFGTFQLMANTGVHEIHYTGNASPMNLPTWTFSGTATWSLKTDAIFGTVNVMNGTLKTNGNTILFANFMISPSANVIADSSVFKASTYFSTANFSVAPTSASDFSAAELKSTYDTLNFYAGNIPFKALHVEGKGFKFAGKAFFGDVYISKSTLVMNAGDTLRFKTISATTGYTDGAHANIDTNYIWINNGTVMPLLKDVDGGDNCLYFTRIVGVKATGAIFHATQGAGNPYVGAMVAGDYMLSPPLNYVLSGIAPTCNGGTDGKGIVVVTGGNPPYNANWVIHYGMDFSGRAFYANNDTVYNVMGGTDFDVHVYDNYCSLYLESMTVPDISINPGPIFKGYVLCGADTVKYGSVNVFYDDGSGKFARIISANVDPTGFYYADKGSAGNYILQYSSGIIPDTLMPTYYAFIGGKDSAAYNWVGATPFNGIPCGAVNVTNIHALKSLNQSSGTAFVGGKVTEGYGYQQFKFIEGSNHTFTVGEPIRDVGVGLGKVPGGSMLSATTTDFNGNYNFDSIPPGTYQVYVDLPGLPHTAFHTVTITGNDSLPNQNYFVDSANVFIIPPTGIKYSVKETGSLKTFPNPYNNFVTIQFETKKKEDVVLQIFDVLGNDVSILESRTLNEGIYTYSFSAKDLGYPAGVYFIKLRIGNELNTMRVIEMQ